MNFRKLLEVSRPHFYSLEIDKYFPKRFRDFFRYTSVFAALGSFVLSFDTLPLYLGRADGMFFLFTFIYLLLFFLEVFYRSMKGEGVRVRIKEDLVEEGVFLDYGLSQILFSLDEIDVTRSIFETKIGRKILERCGIEQREMDSFIYSDRVPVMSSTLVFEREDVSLYDFVSAVYDADKFLEAFLSKYSITKKEFLGATFWIMDMEDKKRRKERFWSRENLGTIPSIGSSWSYGVSSDLPKFSRTFHSVLDSSVIDTENGYRGKEVVMLENILERKHEANAIIIDDDQNVARDILSRLIKKIKLGVSLPSIEHKQVVELDWNSLIASFKNKSELEAEILKILNQAVGAGNIILYIEDLPGFVSSIKSSGVALAPLISPYLLSPDLQVVASAGNSDFHFFIETSPVLLERFERIIPDSIGVEASLPSVLEQVIVVEKEYRVLITFPAVLAIVSGADKYITYGEMPSKAIDILFEIAPWAEENKIRILKESDVSSFLSEKTGIGTGAVSDKESLKLERLDSIMHERIIGQNDAVESVISAVRRARAEIRNTKRPISSFLFLGSTGVGKTEVAKALADSYFGGNRGEDKNMIRLDMTEYSGIDALSRLIGDFTMNRTGIMASLIRDNPYSVLLLDEFEKASPDVLNLFLQVLDEGVFTDALGKQVMCRNLIIIATSNAGSDIIWENVKLGKSLKAEKDHILDTLIKTKVFRPELINRFDGVILFEPLGKKELEGVANIGLSKLKNRLKEKSFDFEVTPGVVQYLVEKGSDPEFGGRSINRAIQNEIEDLVSRKIISGKVKPGDKIKIQKEELGK